MIDMKVTVNKEELILTIRDNRARHLEQYEDAMNGWRQTVAEVFEQSVNLAKSGELKRLSDKVASLLNTPSCHTDQYDKVLVMLKRHTESTIELGATDFDRYVEDNWDWRDHWTFSNTQYLGTTRA